MCGCRNPDVEVAECLAVLLDEEICQLVPRDTIFVVRGLMGEIHTETNRFVALFARST